jgi:hypothetical protein
VRRRPLIRSGGLEGLPPDSEGIEIVMPLASSLAQVTWKPRVSHTLSSSVPPSPHSPHTRPRRVSVYHSPNFLPQFVGLSVFASCAQPVLALRSNTKTRQRGLLTGTPCWPTTCVPPIEQRRIPRVNLYLQWLLPSQLQDHMVRYLSYHS